LRRRYLFAVAVIVGCIVVGGVAGTAVRWWVAGLNGQRAHLHECVVTSQQMHPNENAASMLAHFQAEVPSCMATAGYIQALDNKNCSPQLWQGDVYCYEPKSAVGKLLFKIAVSL
jgi:hypothetical protein